MASTRASMPTSDEFAVWSSFIRTVEILRARVQAGLHTDSGLSEADYKVLLELSEAEARSLRSASLATALEWERSRVSAHLGRMEKRGLIRREPISDDGRGSLVVLTDEGAHAFRASMMPHLQTVKKLFVDAFTADQLAAIDDATVCLRSHLGLPPSERATKD
jgi:DNA-binding MarR family transcriptional regulator